MEVSAKILSKVYDRIVKIHPEFAQGNGRPKRPLLKETAPLSSYISTYFKWMTDPDNVLKYKAKGKGRQFYDNMVDDDPHIAACVNIRKLAVTGLGYEIMPHVERGQAAPNDKAIEYADIIERALNRMNNFNMNMREILQAIQHGYSIGELMWRIDSDMIVCEDIKNHRPDNFKFDKDGELYYVSGNQETVLDKNKFFCYAFNPRYNNPYGTSVLRAVYWPYWFKTNMIKFLVLFAERFGNPALIGKYPAGWSPAQVNELVESLITVQGTSVGAVPEDTAIEILQSSNAKADFTTVLNFFNSEISKGIIGQTLSTDEGMRVGSMALGKVHESVRMDILEADSIDLSYAINEQLINRLIDYNFGDIVEKPTFRISYQDPTDIEKMANAYRTLAGMGVEFPKKYIHDEFGIPMPELDENTYGGSSSSLLPPGLSFGASDGGRAGKDEEPPRFKGTQLFRLVGKQAAANKKPYDIATNIALYDEFYDIIQKMFGDIQTNIFKGLELSKPMQGLIDQAVRLEFEGPRGTVLADIIGQNIDLTTSHFANLFGLGTVEKQLRFDLFQRIKNDYLTKNFYAKGKLEGVAETTRKLLSQKIPDWPDVGFDYADMRRTLSQTFTKMKPWRAHMIAQTELSNAAHHAAFSMIESTGIEFEAYFLVDPASCNICTEIASRNPHTIEEAKRAWPPHIQCNDQFEFVQKGEEKI